MMVEVKILSSGDKISYKGLIDLKGVYDNFTTWIGNNGYDSLEKETHENIDKDGKEVFIKHEPFIEISEYALVSMTIVIKGYNLKPKVVQREGIKRRYLEGKVEISIDSFLVTDRQGKWSGNPLYFFIRTMIDIFFFKSTLTQYEERVINDKELLLKELRGYLNIQGVNS